MGRRGRNIEKEVEGRRGRWDEWTECSEHAGGRTWRKLDAGPLSLEGRIRTQEVAPITSDPQLGSN